jgi:hypothetical protein
MTAATLPTIGSLPLTADVVNLAGTKITLLTQEEADFYVEAQSKYLSENTFTVASDLRAIDRLVLFETMVNRSQAWLASGVDYTGHTVGPAQETDLRRMLKETSALIAQIQNDLGLTKEARDRDQADSVGGYIKQLQLAARAHGVKREKELGKALEMLHEIFGMAGAYLRANEAEREKLGYESPDDVLRIITEVHKPEFDELDRYFRAHEQSFWIRKI